jgi:hypothetical protein
MELKIDKIEVGEFDKISPKTKYQTAIDAIEELDVNEAIVMTCPDKSTRTAIRQVLGKYETLKLFKFKSKGLQLYIKRISTDLTEVETPE